MDNRINEIRARCEAATKGSWKRYDKADYAEIHNGNTWGKDLPPIALVGDVDDARFIINAREDIPYLLDELERVTAERDAAVADLQAFIEYPCVACIHLQDQPFCYENCQNHARENYRAWEWRGPRKEENDADD